MKKSWKLFPTISAPMPLQMTLDRLLFERHQTQIQNPVFRFFYSSAPWVSVGYAAEKKAGYALSASQHSLQNIPVCRRMTGGGTVIHGNDLIFSLFARKQDNPEKFESVETSYHHIHEAVRRAFQKLGKSAQFFKENQSQNGRDCFLNPVETDLHFDDKKIAGGAQKRSGDVFLHEESIQPPVGMSLPDLEKEIRTSFETYFEIKFESAMIQPEILFSTEKQSGDCVVYSTSNDLRGQINLTA